MCFRLHILKYIFYHEVEEMKTVMKKKKNRKILKKMLCICMSITLVVNVTSIVCAESELNESELYARSAVLMDGDNGRILFSKDADKVMPMASTTKVMTCMIALEYGNLDDIYTVSSYAASMPQVKLGVVTGEQYQLGDLLYSLMLESHNDVAVVIAEGVAGSVEEFAKLMNQKAVELGCVDTQFVTPNGLDASGHYTTAAELGKIMAYAIQNETFLKITQTRSYSFSSYSGNGDRVVTVSNKNAFLDSFVGCISGKTGYTGGAGYCYVGAVQKEEKTFIAVVLACGWPPNKTYKWHDMRLLINYGLDDYEYKTIFEGVPLLDIIQVKDGQNGEVSIHVSGDVTLLMREGESYHIEYDYPSVIEAPVEVGECIGEAYIYVGEALVETFPISLLEGDKKIDLAYCLNRIVQLFMLK